MFAHRNNRIDSMNQITDRIWLGDYVSACSKMNLNKHSITHVLTVGSGLPPKFPTQYKYMIVNVWDMPSVNLRQHFDACHAFI